MKNAEIEKIIREWMNKNPEEADGVIVKYDTLFYDRKYKNWRATAFLDLEDRALPMYVRVYDDEIVTLAMQADVDAHPEYLPIAVYSARRKAAIKNRKNTQNLMTFN